MLALQAVVLEAEVAKRRKEREDDQIEGEQFEPAEPVAEAEDFDPNAEMKDDEIPF